MLGFFSRKAEESEDIIFLTTQGMSYYLESMFLKAEEKIVIVAPYIQIHARLKEILIEKARQGIEITVVCRMKDLKDDLSAITSRVIDSPHLHAKCYLTEKCALIGSLNLYDFSQINNEEMGILVKRSGLGEPLYDQIHTEAKRLSCRCVTAPENENETRRDTLGLKKGEEYEFKDLDSIFDFDYKKSSRIKTCKLGHIVLFHSSKSDYNNQISNGMLHFQGQNTGAGSQKLIYGNKVMSDAYGQRSACIHFFEDLVYEGMVYVADEPYLRNGSWYFPLSRVR